MAGPDARPRGLIAFIADMLAPRELIALTGGGGKTSLMFALAHELCRHAKVLTTTTTHIAEPEPADSGRVMLGAERWDDWRAALGQARHVTIAASEERGKLRGFPPEIVDEVYRRELARYVVVEADGAKRMPFKAYEEYEPVIPQATTLHVVVVGIEPFLYPLSEENTFRFGLLVRRHGFESGEKIAPEAIADLLDDPCEYMRGADCATRRILFVNKCEMADENRISCVCDLLSSRLQSYDFVLFASLRENLLYDCATIGRERGGAARP